jgi:long-subunit acyl-CoA synthetase (AMP-forming)
MVIFLIRFLIFFKRLRNQLGIGQAGRVGSGAAELAATTSEWYQSIGVRIIQA